MYPNGDVTVTKKFTATSANMLSGTELEKIPADGAIFLWVGSTVATATLTVPTRNPLLSSVANDVPLQAAGVPDTRQVPSHRVKAIKGDAPILILGGTTGTVMLHAVYKAGAR